MILWRAQGGAGGKWRFGPAKQNPYSKSPIYVFILTLFIYLTIHMYCRIFHNTAGHISGAYLEFSEGMRGNDGKWEKGWAAEANFSVCLCKSAFKMAPTNRGITNVFTIEPTCLHFFFFH